MKFQPFALALAALALLAWTAPPAHASDGEASDISACGHLDELEAARLALESQDREGALIHLRTAREILKTCAEIVDRQNEATRRSLPKAQTL
jgi:hypothetical protein